MMRIYLDQIPEGLSTQDYPEETEFILDDTRPERDPVTLKLIPRAKRELIYPEDCK